MDVAVVDGDLVPDPDRSADRLLGLTCFETIAFDDGALVAEDRHLERLARSARTLGLGPKGGWEAVDEAIETALDASDHERGIVRVSLHAEGEPVGLQLADPRASVQVLVTAPRYGELSEGVSAVTSTIQAPSEGAWPTQAKIPCLPRYLAHREARGRGAFEGLMLDDRDRVVSGTRSNVFVRSGDAVVTPPSPPAFPGITRGRLIDALGEEEIRVRPLERSSLDQADELWLTFTGPGVVPIVELDGAPIGDGTPGEATSELARRLDCTGSTGRTP